jgi:hypothetical protein
MKEAGGSRRNSLKTRILNPFWYLNGFAKAEEAERLPIAMAQIHCQGESHNEKRLADGQIQNRPTS